MKSLSDLATQCIRCGFCLESCPTYLETGVETESPRGRIYLARSAEAETISWKQAAPHLDSCLGCRACETACPSGVQYGAILELAREKTGRINGSPDRLLKSMTNPQAVRVGLAAAELLPGEEIPGWLASLTVGANGAIPRPSKQSNLNWPNLREATLPPIREYVWLLEGCAMKELYPRVHRATYRLLRRIGIQAESLPAGCCGALHAHTGKLQEGIDRGRQIAAALGDRRLVVNSAGCGSHLKDLAKHDLVPEFAGKVVDISEILSEPEALDLLTPCEWPLQYGDQTSSACYHDACHLSHGQGIRSAPRDLLGRIQNLNLIPLPESEVCCGSAGTYSFLQPDMARRLLKRKIANIQKTGAQFVILGNPGCHAWIEFGVRTMLPGVTVLHTVEALELAYSGVSELPED